MTIHLVFKSLQLGRLLGRGLLLLRLANVLRDARPLAPDLYTLAQSDIQAQAEPAEEEQHGSSTHVTHCVWADPLVALWPQRRRDAEVHPATAEPLIRG